MLIDGKPQRTIWVNEHNEKIEIIDQTALPHQLIFTELKTVEDAFTAIRDMLVRGAPLIGVTAAYGMALACKNDSSIEHLRKTKAYLDSARPTAINLMWATDIMLSHLSTTDPSRRKEAALQRASQMADADVSTNESIGKHGATLIKKIASNKADNQPVNILTHCNAGWLATVDWGTALAPIYRAFDDGVSLHVWVDETRPRNQGASLTCWELGKHGVPHTLIVDNAGGHLMQHEQVDICIVGSDRTTSAGDVCNKVGTYLKAVAAKDNAIPFYAVLPVSTIDWSLTDGINEIPIEERNPEEVTHISGVSPKGTQESVSTCPKDTRAANIGFDVTPARLITSIITEHGVYSANVQSLKALQGR